MDTEQMKDLIKETIKEMFKDGTLKIEYQKEPSYDCLYKKLIISIDNEKVVDKILQIESR